MTVKTTYEPGIRPGTLRAVHRVDGDQPYAYYATKEEAEKREAELATTCICGALPDHDECGTCAVPPELQDAEEDPNPTPRPPLDYGDEEPF